MISSKRPAKKASCFQGSVPVLTQRMLNFLVLVFSIPNRRVLATKAINRVALQVWRVPLAFQFTFPLSEANTGWHQPVRNSNICGNIWTPTLENRKKNVLRDFCDTTAGCFRFDGFKQLWRRSGQSLTASDFGSNGPRFESGHGRCVESLDKALYSHCPKEKPSH